MLVESWWPQQKAPTAADDGEHKSKHVPLSLSLPGAIESIAAKAAAQLPSLSPLRSDHVHANGTVWALWAVKGPVCSAHCATLCHQTANLALGSFLFSLSLSLLDSLEEGYHQCALSFFL